jgi:hypothetical protein
MDREHILNEIRRTAAANGGEALGRDRFLAETGIRESDWLGKFWPRWSDAIGEAGFVPLQFQRRNDRLESLQKAAELIRKLGRFPTMPEMNLARRADSDFPNTTTLVRGSDRQGNRTKLIGELKAFCLGQEGFDDVLQILKDIPAATVATPTKAEVDGKVQLGYVYLIRSGKQFKIGFSKAALSRASVVSNLSPEGGEIVHLIRTDDMRGIEAYWHNRFAQKRGNGEWFALSAADVAAFKRRKFM